MQKYIIPTLIVILGLGGLGYFIYNDLSLSPHFGEGATTTPKGTLMTDEEGNQYLIEMEEVPSMPPPSLDHPYTPSADLPEDVRQENVQKYNELVAELKVNPQALEKWLMLGAYRKNAGDYTGAEEVWIYVTKAAPSNEIAYNNLGDLYDFYLKDYAKAEVNYKKVISLKPEFVPIYRSLHNLYLHRYQTDTAKAEQILLEGLQKNPKVLDLLVPLADYYIMKGMKDKAKPVLVDAKVAAEAAGREDLVSAIEAELLKLEQ